VEAPWVEQSMYSLTGEHLALFMLTLNSAGASCIEGLLPTLAKIFDFVLHGRAGGISHG